MADLVTDFFSKELERTFSDATHFDSMITVPFETRFEAGIPDDRFNLYIDLDATAIFETDSQVVPTPEELYAILEDAMGPSFIVNIVWQAPNTIWISAYESILGPSDDFRQPEQLDIVPAQGGKNNVAVATPTNNIFGIGSARGRSLHKLPLQTEGNVRRHRIHR